MKKLLAVLTLAAAIAVPMLAHHSFAAEFDGGNTSPGCRTPDGMLWLPSIRGVVRVDPAHIAINRIPPPVQIEQVVVQARRQREFQRAPVKPRNDDEEPAAHYAEPVHQVRRAAPQRVGRGSRQQRERQQQRQRVEFARVGR